MNNVIYLDNAATSFPKPASVVKGCNECLNNFCVNPGRGAHKKSLYASNIVYLAREQLCRLFNIDDPERIAFTMNTTQSINFALKGILQKGDHVIISSMEHNSVLRPTHALSKNGVEYDIAPTDKNGDITYNEIKPFIKKNTKLVCIIHASNVTGKTFDISSVGKNLQNKNILFMTDAAQSAGKTHIDVKKMNIDILCFPGHKGLFSPAGCGGIYISEKVKIRPIIEGGTGSFSESRIQPYQMPDVLESGTQNILGITGVYEGTKFVLKHLSEIIEKEHYLTNVLYDNCKNIKGINILSVPDKNCGIISVVPNGKSPTETAFLLDRDFGIATRAGFHCSPLACKSIGAATGGTLRFSPGFFSTKYEIDKTSMALKKILSAGY